MRRSRLAPSPTGAQHLGNARTHLIAYWAARKSDAELVLRIDDLDSPRVKSWAVQQAIDDLRWLGIKWDRQPVHQTTNVQAYTQAIERLTDARTGAAYPCTCTRKDIENARSAPHESRFRDEGIVYPGTCANFTSGDCVPAEKHCWRLRVDDQLLSYLDLVFGEQSCQPDRDLGDFPITTKDEQATYQLAVVIDDMLQEVDFVVRGSDLIASTFRQLLIHRRLGLQPPQYAHVPLVVGLDGRRLAKRHGDTRLSQYRDSGVAAEQIVGWAAHSLGLIDQIESCRTDDLIEQFDWSKIPRQATVIDPSRLFHR